MDLGNIKTTETFSYTLTHPIGGEDLPVSFEIYGSDSKKYKAVIHRLRNEKLFSKKKNVNSTSEQIDENALIILAECIKSWDGVELDGKKLDCNISNAKRFLSSPGLSWVYDQIDQAIGDRSNFLPSAKKN